MDTISKTMMTIVSAIALSGCGGSSSNYSNEPALPLEDPNRTPVKPQAGATPAVFSYVALYQQDVFAKMGVEPAVKIQMANEEANRIHLYSGTNIQYSVVGIEPAPEGVIPKERMDNVLYRTQTIPGNFTRQKMDEYNADFIMIINGGDGSNIAGLTWVGPDTSGDYRNIVVDGYYMGGVVVAHELGHLLGLHHNSTEAPESYAVGYMNNEGQFYTVMNYGAVNYMREWVFSSPNLLCGKTEKTYPCGIPIGSPGQADSVTAMIQNKAAYGR